MAAPKGNKFALGNDGGRPTLYSQELSDEICAHIADGLSVRKICAMEGMPNMVTIFNWLAKHDEFVKQYTHAREIQAESHADGMVDLADEPPERTATGSIDPASVNDKRLRIDTRKWIASKLLPKKYGDRQTIDLNDVTPKTQDEVDAELIALIKKAAKK